MKSGHMPFKAVYLLKVGIEQAVRGTSLHSNEHLTHG